MKNFKLLVLSLFLITSCSTDSVSSPFESDISGSAESGETQGSGNNPNPDPGQITAGEWNDLDNWDFWLDLMEDEDYAEVQDYWGFYTMNRLAFEIENNNAQPVNGATVSLYRNSVLVAEAKTDNSGIANLYIDLNEKHSDLKNLSNYNIKINSIAVEHQLIPISQGINQINIDNTISIDDRIELSFIVDATGSMGDELEFLKTDLQDVITNVQSNNSSSSIYTSSVFYRDTDDEYVVKSSNFTNNLGNTIGFIGDQFADGGGDYPEAVDRALDVAINDLQWSTNAKTKIAFLLLDAPPHHETQIINDIHLSIKTAAAKGIKVIPIAASGIDKPTEFLMRYFAIATNGTYVFITNDSGIGNDHIEASVGEYEVEFLNELLIRLINEYSE